MKKTILVLAFAMLTVFGAFAQDNGKTYLEPTQELRIGYAGALKSGSTNVLGGLDFGINILEMGVRPYETGRISLGVEFNYNYFNTADGYYFASAAHKTTVVPSIFKHIKSANASVMYFGLPLNFAQTIGNNMEFSIGATAKFNLNADTFVRYKNDTDDYCTMSVEGIRTRRFSFDAHIAFTYDGFGVYASYSPMSVFEPGFGPSFGYFTVGAIFRMDAIDK